MADDLDALLDDALDSLDKQEEEHKADVQRRDEELASTIASEGTGGSDPVMQQLQSVFASLSTALNSQNLEDPEAMAKVTAALDSTINSLKNDPNTTAEEREELDRCASLATKLSAGEGGDGNMSEEDAAKLQEMVANMMKAGEAADPAEAAKAAANGTTDEAELKQMVDMFEFFKKQQEEAQAAASAGTAAAAPAGNTEGVADAPPSDDAQRLLVDLLSNPAALVQPFRDMEGKYQAYLDTTGPTLASDDRERYAQQFGVIRELLAFVDGGGLNMADTEAGEADRKLQVFGDLTSKLQALGAPPAELTAQ